MEALTQHKIKISENKDKVDGKHDEKREKEKSFMKNHYGSLKHKPKIIPSIASSRDNVLDKDGKPVDGGFLSYRNAND